MPDVKFRISSALKNIIGSDLITDDFIAVFELVKNSFDAEATVVNISFVTEGGIEKLIIADNGYGMSYEDLINKWLFVAYSEKRAQLDYRTNVRLGRALAGAKGIGRFSCDRLGTSLKLYTRREDAPLGFHILDIDWSLFESNAESEFQTIPSKYRHANSIPFDLSHGTVLEISNLRNHDWSRDKLIQLRRSLERLVNPIQANDQSGFVVNLIAPHELTEDNQRKAAAKANDEEPINWSIVNGPIVNFIFEELGMRTTQIVVRVDASGSSLITQLTDRGTLIYEIAEKNSYDLHDISINLFHLDRGAKSMFTRRMGVSARDYGSVFLYKNGFRIHPIGNPDDDTLGIDRRHQQGVFRTLGTRDLSGRIAISGNNFDFRETSSRDGGLILTPSVEQLKSLFLDVALKRLERYVIDLAKFGPAVGELPDLNSISSSSAKEAVLSLITKLAASKDVTSIKYDPAFLNILESKSSESVDRLIRSLRRIVADSPNAELAPELAKAEKHYSNLVKAKEESERSEQEQRERARKAEAEAHSARRERELVQKEKAALDTQNIFLKSALSKDLVHVLKLHHSIGQDALTIEHYVTGVLSDLSKTPLDLEAVKHSIERISFVAKKIAAASRFATQANHVSASEEVKGDVIAYCREYITNIYDNVVFGSRNERIKIAFTQDIGQSFETKYKPISISIVLDNLISNSRKHRASSIQIAIESVTSSQLAIIYSDNGTGFGELNLETIFELGFTTTDGSGLGLYHVRQVLGGMNGTIEAISGEHGAAFRLTLRKR